MSICTKYYDCNVEVLGNGVSHTATLTRDKLVVSSHLVVAARTAKNYGSTVFGIQLLQTKEI